MIKRKKIFVLLLCILCCSCGGGGGGSSVAAGNAVSNPHTDPQSGPPAGNPSGNYTVPAEASAVDTSTPDHIVGTGTPGSCTAEAFIHAVSAGGKITFNCGSNPHTITLDHPAKLFNNKPDVVIDGG